MAQIEGKLSRFSTRAQTVEQLPLIFNDPDEESETRLTHDA